MLGATTRLLLRYSGFRSYGSDLPLLDRQKAEVLEDLIRRETRLHGARSRVNVCVPDDHFRAANLKEDNTDLSGTVAFRVFLPRENIPIVFRLSSDYRFLYAERSPDLLPI